MSSVKYSVLFLIVGIVTFLDSLSLAAEKPLQDSGFWEVSLADGGLINLRILTKETEIVTRYGKLRVPIADIRRINLGQHDQYLIVTDHFPIAGRIEGLALKAQSTAFGEVDLRLKDVRQMRRVKAEAEPMLETDAAPALEINRKIEPDLYDVRLADGSLINVRLLNREVAITSSDKVFKVLVTDIRRIDVGLRYAEGVEKRVEAAVTRLGDSDFNVREDAGKELLRLKELAYSALKRAVKSEDPEIRRRASDLMSELENKILGEQLRIPDYDVIATKVFPVTGRIQEVTLKCHSSALGDLKLRVADLRQVRRLTAELIASQLILERVRTAVIGGHINRSQQMGTGKESYEEVPKEGALLIGFEITYGKFGNSPTIQTFCPIFQTASGRVIGKTHGVKGNEIVRVEAKPGYAVGDVTIKAGLGVDGMSVTFMEIRDGALDPKRSYESEWLGGMGGGEKTKLAGTGAPVIGIFGKVAEGPTSTFNGLGLVTAKSEK